MRTSRLLSCALVALVLTPALMGAGSPGAARINEIPGGQLWAPPLGLRFEIIAPFRAPPRPYAAGHRGFDLSASSGVVVRAPASGIVSFAGTVVDRSLVSIRVDARTVVSLEPVTTKLTVGDMVPRGSEIGKISEAGSAGGHCGTKCLHLGVRVDGKYVNPMRYFAGRAQLLPW